MDYPLIRYASIEEARMTEWFVQNDRSEDYNEVRVFSSPFIGLAPLVIHEREEVAVIVPYGFRAASDEVLDALFRSMTSSRPPYEDWRVQMFVASDEFLTMQRAAMVRWPDMGRRWFGYGHNVHCTFQLLTSVNRMVDKHYPEFLDCQFAPKVSVRWMHEESGCDQIMARVDLAQRFLLYDAHLLSGGADLLDAYTMLMLSACLAYDEDRGTIDRDRFDHLARRMAICGGIIADVYESRNRLFDMGQVMSIG